MARRAAIVVLMAWLVAADVQAAGSVVGKWKTVDESGKIQSEVDIYEQGGKIFGKITSLSEPYDRQGRPKVCGNCGGADKDQPIVGLVIIRDLSLKGDRYKDGTIVDPKDGKVYKAELWVEDDKLKVRGYLGVFYRTQTWLKAA